MNKKRKDIFHVNQKIQGGVGLGMGEPVSRKSDHGLDFKDNAGQNKRVRLASSATTEEKGKSLHETGKKEKSPYFVTGNFVPGSLEGYLWDGA